MSSKYFEFSTLFERFNALWKDLPQGNLRTFIKEKFDAISATITKTYLQNLEFCANHFLTQDEGEYFADIELYVKYFADNGLTDEASNALRVSSNILSEVELKMDSFLASKDDLSGTVRNIFEFVSLVLSKYTKLEEVSARFRLNAEK